MSAKKREETTAQDQGQQTEETSQNNVNPFEPQLDENTKLNLAELLDNYTKKAAASQETQTKTQARIQKNKEAIARIQANIAKLLERTSSFSGKAWDEAVVSPIVQLLRDIFPGAAIEKSGPLSSTGAYCITITRKNIKPADKLKGVDTKSLTLVPVGEKGLGIRNYAMSTNDYPPGSVGFLLGLNFPVEEIPADKALEMILEHLK